MRVLVSAITDADVRPVAEFLSANMGGGLPAGAWAEAIEVPWKVDAPNHGFMLVADDAVVGVYLAFYSDRVIDGQVERFCNLGSWCVLPDYRLHSLRLLTALLDQQGFHFTDLSPSQRVAPLNERLGFHALDTAAALIPCLPRPGRPGRMLVSSSPNAIEETVAGQDLEIYQDHADAAAVRHLVMRTAADHCYVMFRKDRIRRLPVATVLYVGNPPLFRRTAGRLAGQMLPRHGVLALFVEARVAGGRPRASIDIRLNSNRRMYRSGSLGSDQIDYLYSELTCVDW